MIIGIILVGIMILSTAGYAFYREDKTTNEKIIYNGFEFVNENGFWRTSVNGEKFYFQYLPNETLDIKLNLQKNLNSFSGKPLYYSPQNPGVQEILINFDRYVERYQQACLNIDNCENGLPIKNCTDNFIIFQNKNISTITQEDNCIYILYPDDADVKAADAFLYRILGIN